MVIQHNLASMFTQRELKTITGQKSKSTEKLSSGYKINRSADDSAGLAISEKMRWQIRGLDKASKNIQDGISFVQTGEGALNEVHSMLQRIRELSVQAANDTNTKQDRENLDAEVQQIKEEIEHVFDDTEFNTKKIFRAPYIPTIKNEPQDYAMFNVGAGGSETGGVLINNKRYTWEELGLDKTWNTPSFEDREFVFYDDNMKDKWGDAALEKITLLLKAGDTLPDVRRVYEMSADDTGIKINGVYAGKWDDGTIKQEGLKYSFSHNGCDFSFKAEPGASREEIIKHLNPDGITRLTWEAVPSSKDSWNAVHSTADYTMRLNVTEANKQITSGNSSDIERWKYSIVADEKEVGIVQQNYVVSDGVSHIKTEWKDFKNTDAGEEEYPIEDFGTASTDVYNKFDPVTPKLEHEGNANTITLDDEATYHYTDVDNNAKMPEYIAFDFNFLRDEVGKAEAINGLNQQLSSSGVIAPIKSIPLNNSNAVVVDFAGLNFHFQRDQLLRNFGASGSDAPMGITIERKKINDGTEDSYQERRVLKEAYAGWSKQERTANYSQYGSGLITVDSNGQIIKVEGFTAEGDANLISGQWVNSSDPVYRLMTDNNPTKPDIPSGSPTQTGWDSYVIDGGITDNPDGTKTFQGHVNKLYSQKEYQCVNNLGIYYLDEHNNYKKSSEQQLYVYKTDKSYNPIDPDILRDSNSKVYEKADASGTAQRYVSTGTTPTLDKTYEKNYYYYEVKNSANTVIMIGKSASFIDTGTATKITDSDNDILRDRENGFTNTERPDIAQLPAENKDDTIILLDSTGKSVSYVTDQAIRDVTFYGKNADNVPASITTRYDDREDEDGSKNITVGGKVTPDGKAYRDFYKSAQTAGTAIETNFRIKMNPPEKLLHIQAGALKDQSIDIKWPALTNAIVGIANTQVKSWGQASSAIYEMDEAIEMISRIRTTFGTYHNRLEFAYNIDQNTSENTQAAESRIRDTDMAKEMVSYSKSNILAQAAQSMLSQINQNPQGILSLLQ